MLAEYTARNNAALHSLVHEHKVKLKPFPTDVLKKLRDLSDEVVAEIAAKDEMGKKVFNSFKAFREQARAWHDVSELAYYNARNL